MSNTDSGYRNNSKYLSSTNITGTCSGRVKPRYLGGAGTYSSVSYEWGGFNTVSQFNSAMSPGTGKAGNITDDAGSLTCAYGVDCSGFVSRVWKLTTKYSTSSLPSISYAISAGSLITYDLFNKSGSHAMLYRSRSGSGYYVSEATTASSLDRAVFRWISDSYASGFSTRRFNNVCG